MQLTDSNSKQSLHCTETFIPPQRRRLKWRGFRDTAHQAATAQLTVRLAWKKQWHNSDKVETGPRKVVIAIVLSLDQGCHPLIDGPQTEWTRIFDCLDVPRQHLWNHDITLFLHRVTCCYLITTKIGSNGSNVGRCNADLVVCIDVELATFKQRKQRRRANFKTFQMVETSHRMGATVFFLV